MANEFRTSVENIIEEKARMFHKNFNDRKFNDNTKLVTIDFIFNKNGSTHEGRVGFENELKNIVNTFPDAMIEDLEVIVDGLTAVVHYKVSATKVNETTLPNGSKVVAGDVDFLYESIEICRFTDEYLVYQIDQINSSGLHLEHNAYEQLINRRK